MGLKHEDVSRDEDCACNPGPSTNGPLGFDRRRFSSQRPFSTEPTSHRQSCSSTLVQPLVHNSAPGAVRLPRHRPIRLRRLRSQFGSPGPLFHQRRLHQCAGWSNGHYHRLSHESRPGSDPDFGTECHRAALFPQQSVQPSCHHICWRHIFLECAICASHPRLGVGSADHHQQLFDRRCRRDRPERHGSAGCGSVERSFLQQRIHNGFRHRCLHGDAKRGRTQ